MTRPSGKHAGLTLIELMIALVIGLLLMLVIGNLFIKTKTTFRTQEAMAHLNENARLATSLLERDLRMAGHIGCPQTLFEPPPSGFNPSISNIAKPVGRDWITFNKGVQGYAQSALPSGLGLLASEVLADTDVIRVQYADNLNGTLKGNLATDAAAVEVRADGNHGIKADDILFISDCNFTDVFRAASVSFSENTNTVTIAHDDSSNISSSFGTPYREGTQLMKLATYIYFIACVNSSGGPTGQCAASDTRYLWRKGLNGIDLIAQDLAAGVENMRILYGEDTDGDSIANKYVAVANVGDWTHVVGIRVSLLLSTVEDQIAILPRTFDFNGRPTATDRRVRRVYTSTVNLRNRSY